MSAYKLIRPKRRTAPRLATASRWKWNAARARSVSRNRWAKTENNG